MNDLQLNVTSPASLIASVREKSQSTLAQALRGEQTEQAKAAIYQRATVCLASFYDPDLDPEVKAQVRGAFVKALIDLPLWAVMRGFDEWEKSSTNRPSPANVRMLAQQALRPITDELARRQRQRDALEAERKAAERPRMSPDALNSILKEAGFTPKRLDAVRKAPMAGSFDEAEAQIEAARPLHWSDAPTPDRAALAALEVARAANPIIREAMEQAARKAAQQAATGR